MKPNPEEINELVTKLIDEYRISTRFINILWKESDHYEQLRELIETRVSKVDKLKLLINSKEALFFSGSSKRIIQLRAKLLDNLADPVLQELYSKFGKENYYYRSMAVRELSKKRWITGRSWSMAFINTFGFPRVFAGMKSTKRPPRFMDVLPFKPPPPLKRFQKEIKKNLITVLNNEGDHTRCIVSLPTGGGKTRTAVEAFIEWLKPRFDEGKYLIWIAQSEELCNQVIECIGEIWQATEFTEPLRVYRYYSGQRLSASELIGGVVVASINQIHARMANDECLSIIVNNTGSIIIDEAHRAVSQMYKDFFEYCKTHHSPELFPICGLTATPGRSYEHTPVLVDTFESTLFTPTLGERFQEDPLEYFRSEDYLARPVHKVVNTHITIPHNNHKTDETQDDFIDRMDRVIVRDLERNAQRNRLILKELLSIPEGELTLVYACSVRHAELLSMLLNHRQRSATAISTNTPRYYRLKLLEQFKARKIQFVTNYGVLTTGFDAPKVKNIVICRPTFSEVLYEQIVGRGLRGEKFGGTKECNIIDFSDNYERFGDQQAYFRFQNFWNNNI